MAKKYLFGICEVFEGPIQPGITPDRTVDIIAALGCKSMRVWMHHRDLLELDREGKPRLIPSKIVAYKALLKKLIDNGVTHLTGMNHCYLHPEGFEASSWNVIPLPDGDVYIPFLRLQTESCAILARAFPEIKFWEVGNEVNFDRFIAKPGYPDENPPPEGEYPGLSYTEDEKAQITVDICYYSCKGVKVGNSKAKVVIPSPAGGSERTAGFIEMIYKHIESGKFPRGSAAATDTDDYFHILSWHPYNFDGVSERLVDFYNEVYGVAERHGDGRKPVFITEFGYHDSDLVKFGITQKESDERQAAYLLGDYERLKGLKHLETVHYFRLFDWEDGPGIEKDFGLFTSPDNPAGLIPKAKGLALYKYFNGAAADIRKLYMHANTNVQGDKEFIKNASKK
ncbi:MAG: hypothetical protein LBS99_01785 [Clostridiales bacterium]|jgi:hypothetical protein|nr:hypothetical protein [Clostridiales bacterium]